MSYIYINGKKVQTGSHGDTDYVFASGDPVPNEGASELVYESGVGVGGSGDGYPQLQWESS